MADQFQPDCLPLLIGSLPLGDHREALEMDFKSGTQTNLLLNAPFADNEEVGIVVLDQNGNVVHSSAGTYKNMKDLRFADYYSQDMTYVVRVYSSSAVFETKLQVVYR